MHTQLGEAAKEAHFSKEEKQIRPLLFLSKCAFLSQEYLPFHICTVEGVVTFIFLLLLLHI